MQSYIQIYTYTQQHICTKQHICTYHNSIIPPKKKKSSTSEEDVGLEVSEDWQCEGAHLGVSVLLCIGSKPVNIHSQFNMENALKIKVRPLPFKMSFMDDVHRLYAALAGDRCMLFRFC